MEGQVHATKGTLFCPALSIISHCYMKFILHYCKYRVIHGRKSVDPGLKSALIAQKLKLEAYYHCEDMEFEMKKEDSTVDTIVRPTFLCHDMNELKELIAQERDINLDDCLLKFSIDKGNEKLKCGLNIIEKVSPNTELTKKRARYEEGIAPCLHKSSSANMMQILAMVPSIQESYYNLKIILDNLPGI